nr:MAG: Alpha/Beta hydrolase protein [Podila humilis]
MITAITDTSLAQVSIPGYGILQGDIDQQRNIAIFRNVPYAKVPERWRPAVKPDSWTGVRDATKQGPICPQNPSNYPLAKLSPEEVYNVPGKSHPFGLDHEESDSLNLNIFVPLEALKNRASVPVMVWVHDASNLVQRSAELGWPTIVISINYRVNVFGFLASKELQVDAVEYTTANPGVSAYEQSVGNWGFMNMKLAFQWVRENIQIFGGDNQNVTAFGESAGSILIHFSILTPAHYGLFDHAIMQSGTVATMPAGIVHVDGQPLFDELLSKLEIPLNLSPAEKVKKLRAVPTNKLTLVGEQMTTGAFRLYYDGGKILPSDRAMQLRALEPSAYDPCLKSLMIGANKDEGSAFTSLLDGHVNLATWPHIVERIVPVPELRPLFETVYGVPESDLQVYKTASQVVSDNMFLYPTEVVSSTFVELAKQRQGGFNFSRYHFDAVLGYMDTIIPGLGAMHAGEISFVFGPPMADKYMTSKELDLSKDMQELWLLFANQQDYTAKGSNAIARTEKGQAWIISDNHQIEVGESLRLSKEALLYWGKISGAIANRTAVALSAQE